MLIETDFLDPKFVENPYATFDSFRSVDAPVQTAKGVWYLSKYEDAAAALLHKSLSNRPAPFAAVHERHKDTFVAADIARHLIAFQDPPDATLPRRLMATQLQAYCRGLDAVLLGLAKEVVKDLPSGDFDVIGALAKPFALRSTCALFGLPDSDSPKLKEWSETFFNLFHAIPDNDALKQMNEGLAAFRAYVSDHCDQADLSDAQGLTAILKHATGTALDPEALSANVMLLIADSIENVWAGIGSAVRTVIQHQDAAQQFLTDGGPMSAIADECLRLESPGQYQGRIALEPLEIGGAQIRKYEVVLVGLAAANRDPRVFAEPDQFDPARKGPRHLAFGLGRHACIGGTLVRQQMSAVLTALWPILPTLAAAKVPPQWQARAGHRWLATLPVQRS